MALGPTPIKTFTACGAEGPCKRVTSVSNGLVGDRCGGADRDMDPIGATPAGGVNGEGQWQPGLPPTCLKMVYVQFTQFFKTRLPRLSFELSG